MEEIDIFDDIGDHKSEERAIFSKNWERLTEPIKQEGFREGIAAGKEESFQNGFDEGYSTGFKAGLSIGYYNSILKTLACHKFNVPPDLDLDISSLTPIVNPTRGFCHLCTESGQLLSKSEIESNLERSAHVPLDEVISKQNSIINSEMVNRQTLPEFVKVLDKLGIKTN